MASRQHRYAPTISLTISAKKISTYNSWGDEQTDADLKSQEILVAHFKKTEVIREFMSKETPNVIYIFLISFSVHYFEPSR